MSVETHSEDGSINSLMSEQGSAGGSAEKTPGTAFARKEDLQVPESWQEKTRNYFGVQSYYVLPELNGRGLSIKKYAAPKYKDLMEELAPEVGYIKERLSALENRSYVESQDSYEKLLEDALNSMHGFYDWGGRRAEKIDYFYNDFPAEAEEYVFAVNEILLPVLFSIERSVKTDEERDRAAESLLKYVNISGEGSDSEEVCVSLAKVGGLSSADAFLKKLGHVRAVQQDYYRESVQEDIDDTLLFLRGERDDFPNYCGYGEDVESAKALLDYLTKTLPENGIIPMDPDEMEFGDRLDFVAAYMDTLSLSLQSGEDREKFLQFVSELMEHEHEGMLSAYVRAIKNAGVEESTPMLLGNLKSENIDKMRLSAEILFRLELGKMGVTTEGVECLGKLYDLGKYNNPDFFVRRLNDSGLMAVLSEKEGGIEGVFPLNIYAEENAVQAEVRQLMSQELFLPKADESAGQRQERERYLQLFMKNYELIFNDKFFEGTGLRLNSLDLHEQGWFLLSYLELSGQENTEGLTRLKSFVTEYGEYGLKSFLALEYGGSGQEILDFAEAPGLSKEAKLAIFKNFYAIANEALNWRGVFGQAETGAGYEFAPQVHEAFVRKNAEFLKAAQIIAGGKGGDVTIGELMKNMDTIVFSLRALKGVYEKNSDLKLEQKPQIQDERDKDGNLIESASSSFILLDEGRGARIVVSIRPHPTARQGNSSGGEARMNFSVTNLRTYETARIGFDLSDYGEFTGEADKPPTVSLDMGVGKPDRVAGIWPSQRVGRVLELVEGSEGGHNELSFKPEVAEHFPDVAERFRGYIESKFVVWS